MAELIYVTDPDDPRLDDFVRLRDSQLRIAKENRRSMFIAEGIKIIERALTAGYQPLSFLLTKKWLAGLEPALASVSAPVIVMDESTIEKVTGFHVHRGALAAFARRGQTEVSAFFDMRRVVLCEDIVDHANLGAIIRCAAGLGWDGVAVSHRSADPLYRRAIKASMGTVLSLPWIRLPDRRDIIDQFVRHGFTTVAFALRDDAIPLADFASTVGREDKIALMLGTEGEGLSTEWIDSAQRVVTIPMSRGVDSLNVAAAAAIGCYCLASGEV